MIELLQQIEAETAQKPSVKAESFTNDENTGGEDELELYDIPNDTYNFVFLAPMGSQGFWFGLWVFAVKICLYTFLALDSMESLRDFDNDSTTTTVLTVQCLMLPVAVAMQEDLIVTYTLISNVKYSKLVLNSHPFATKFKYYFANTLRGIDGVYSLFINFVVLLLSETVLGLFLNFAALQFLQTIDNMALTMAKDGFFTPTLEEYAVMVGEMQMPKRHNTSFFTALDSVFFLSTLENLLVAWYMLKIY